MYQLYYLKDSKKFKDLLNNCPGSCFQKIGTIDFVDDNENFKSLILPSLLPIIKGLKEKGFSFKAIPYHPLK